MRKLLKWIGMSLLVVLLVLGGGLLWYRSASQPQIDGRLQMAGLSAPVAPVDIVRDAEGVPHIYASTDADAYFALGFVHAQDRLWQLEMNRRIAAGRMAEILGPNALGTDRFLRTLGIRRNAERILANLSPEARAVLDAYARGINAYLATRKGPLPPEFVITGAPAPEPWQPADSIAWQTMMAWDLGANWSQEILRMRLAQRLSLQQIQQFLAPYPGDAPLATMDYTNFYRQLAGTTQQLAAVRDIAPPSLVEGMGSNNWAVSGKLSTTGKPLLANDPHLGLSVPSLWYFAHLSAPGLNVIGGMLPGIPVVVLGHNDRIAWAFTNTAPDVQDLYIERIHPENHQQYQTPSGWAAFKRRVETIKVKGAPDVRLEVRESRHGPIITGALPVLEKTGLDAQQYAVAFAWTALRDDDLTLQSGVELNHAKNWTQFLQAARHFSAPQQNMVYADVDGNIGFIAAGMVPIRKPGNDLKGLAPAPGWLSRYDWDGFIPFAQLPQQFNPASQRIVTANQKIVDDRYRYFLTSEWTLPYRADRIAELLSARPLHDLDSFAAIQKDDLSPAMRDLLPVLRQTTPRSAQARAALDLLAHWDGRMTADRAEPLIATAWVRALSKQIFSDELGADIVKEYWEYRNFQRVLVNVLHDTDGQSRWCRDTSQAVAEQAAGCGAALSISLDAALADLRGRYGDDMHKWRWGVAHMAHAAHRPFGKIPALARWFDIDVPSPGDAFSINAGRNNPGDALQPYANVHAPGLRALYDLGNLENSRFMHSSGQSGNVFSPLYRNFAARWAAVQYVPMRMKREAVEQGSLGVLTLTP
ncbi:MAG: penicillin acylase family protein [Proteobacteria bacterium]|nr:penicillin acylase family protein [Pseudomonadota bacterium]